MRKKLGLSLLVVLSVLLASCDNGKLNSGHNSEPIQVDAWPTIEEISNRAIIARLEQTAKDTTQRDEYAKQAVEAYGLTEKPPPEQAEYLATQAIEGQAATTAMNEIYGENFDRVGVAFFENQSTGASRSAFWIGLKNPDAQLEKLVKKLQAQVDAGDILAEHILIFRSNYTAEDLQKVQNEMTNSLKQTVPKNASFSVSADVITGIIHIEHDFLTDDEQKSIKSKFSNEQLVFKQSGRLAPAPGESMYQYPKELYTTVHLTEGGYIHAIEDERILVAGGKEEATYYHISEPGHQLKVGQRVEVEYTGMILTSFPGQGTAKYIKVLPEYKPANATLTESEAFTKTLEMTKGTPNTITIINSISYNSKTDQWKATIQQGDEVFIIEVPK